MKKIKITFTDGKTKIIKANNVELHPVKIPLFQAYIDGGIHNGKSYLNVIGAKVIKDEKEN